MTKATVIQKIKTILNVPEEDDEDYEDDEHNDMETVASTGNKLNMDGQALCLEIKLLLFIPIFDRCK